MQDETAGVHAARSASSIAALQAPSPRRRWPWVVAAATLAVFVGANLAYPDAEADLVWTGMFTAIIVAFVLVGALLAVRVPANPIGPIILGSGALLATTVAIGTAGIIADQD